MCLESWKGGKSQGYVGKVGKKVRGRVVLGELERRLESGLCLEGQQKDVSVRVMLGKLARR